MKTLAHVSRLAPAALLTLVCLLSLPGSAGAQAFISPLVGVNFGGDARCPRITDCSDTRLNLGVALGVTGSLFGFEEEFAYARDFFGKAPGLSSSVLTVMSNVLFIPRVGPVRPYLVAGVGLMKTHVEFTPSSVLTTDNNNAGWNAGGGIIAAIHPHVGIRGDLRYFRAFQDLDVLGFAMDNQTLEFSRASAALVLTF